MVWATSLVCLLTAISMSECICGYYYDLLPYQTTVDVITRTLSLEWIRPRCATYRNHDHRYMCDNIMCSTERSLSHEFLLAVLSISGCCFTLLLLYEGIWRSAECIVLLLSSAQFKRIAYGPPQILFAFLLRSCQQVYKLAASLLYVWRRMSDICL